MLCGRAAVVGAGVRRTAAVLRDRCSGGRMTVWERGGGGAARSALPEDGLGSMTRCGDSWEGGWLISGSQREEERS